uniref:Olfactory receptor n=1 Tax=Sphenodon punctatus TaxID=8508 RepID=A0A8D0L219_SPHPU
MGAGNQTIVTEFILIGLSNQPKTRAALFFFFLVVYLITLVGNSLIILVVRVDPRLQTTMYFFLSNLSFLDICYSSGSVPQVLANCLKDRPTISFGRCLAQMSITLFLGVTECILLAAMAYDRYVAISNPLRYTLIMNKRVCIQMAVGSWTSAFLLTIVPSFSMQANLCGHNEVDHFTCEVVALLKLACSDTSVNQLLMFASALLTLLLPFSFIIISYTRIIVVILRIHSAGSRFKAFSTCGSHLAVVTIFYGTAIFMYVRPHSKPSQAQDKMVSVFYGAVTPMLNPLIYTLRNQEVKGALRRMTWRKGDY